MTALAGIDPKTKRCEIVGSNTTDTAEEIRKRGYIQVTLPKTKAREIWGEIVPDVYALAADMQLIERGPWKARQQSDDHLKGIFVESDDFTHDVRLYINGDFASTEQKLAYADEIAKRLNAWEVHNAKS